ncbi:hypothetical protein AC623_20695, partial [Bacillus sp. FJAT-27231]
MPFSKKEILKRVGAALAVTTLAAGSLAGCGSDEEEAKEKKKAVAEEKAEKKKDKKVEEVAKESKKDSFSTVDLLEIKNQVTDIAKSPNKEVANVIQEKTNKISPIDRNTTIAAVKPMPTVEIKGNDLAFSKPSPDNDFATNTQPLKDSVPLKNDKEKPSSKDPIIATRPTPEVPTTPSEPKPTPEKPTTPLVESQPEQPEAPTEPKPVPEVPTTPSEPEPAPEKPT